MPPIAGDIPGGLGPGWTVKEEWDIGDLPFIESAGGFSGDPCGDTLAWSLDGTRITLSSGANTQDIIRTFQCSTPFDPSTAFSQVSVQQKLNPGNGVFNGAGTAFYCIHTVGDEIAQFGATQFALNNQAGELSDITKGNVGFTSSTDGGFTINAAGSILFWMGRNGGNRWATFNIPAGNLDAFTTLADVTAPVSIDTSGQKMNAAGNLIVQTRGSNGIRFLTFDDLQTLGSPVAGADQSLAALTAIDIRPEKVWFNPNDTREIWLSDEEGGGVQLGCYFTNVPEPL